MASCVTRLSRMPSYGAAMLIVAPLVVIFAGLLAGPVGDFLTLFGGGAMTGAIVAAWMSMLASVRDRPAGLARGRAFFSADLDRWAPEGLAIGSAIGFALAVLDAWVLA